MDFPSPAQRRAKLFSPGDMVCPFGKPEFVSGIVVEVFPKIGMVDVEFPDRVTRYQADELRNLSNPQYFDPQGNVMQARKASRKPKPGDKVWSYQVFRDGKIMQISRPYREEVMRVEGNTVYMVDHKAKVTDFGRGKTWHFSDEESPQGRTASMDKSALYWAAPDRKYRATRDELPYGPYKCPRCKTEEGECVPMRTSTLQRTEGKNFKIWVCPSCTFAIQDSDVINCPVE